MKLEQLQRRIARAEAMVQCRQQRAAEQWGSVRDTWRGAWTPLRIVLAGVGLGLLAGRSTPLASIGQAAGKLGDAPKLLQAISAISAVIATFKADDVATKAEDTVDAARAGDGTQLQDAVRGRPEVTETGAADSPATPHARPVAGHANMRPDRHPYEVPDTFRDSGQL